MEGPHRVAELPGLIRERVKSERRHPRMESALRHGAKRRKGEDRRRARWPESRHSKRICECRRAERRVEIALRERLLVSSGRVGRGVVRVVAGGKGRLISATAGRRTAAICSRFVFECLLRTSLGGS